MQKTYRGKITLKNPTMVRLYSYHFITGTFSIGHQYISILGFTDTNDLRVSEFVLIDDISKIEFEEKTP